jgi:hypothetical protein
MSTEFWMGIFMSIPIGLATSLATPWFQKRLDQRGKARTLIETKNAQEEYDRIRYFRDNPSDLTQYLVQVAIKTTFITAFLSLFSRSLVVFGSLIRLAHVEDSRYFIQNALELIFQVISLAGSIMIINICRPALNTWTKTKNFAEYESGLYKRGVITITPQNTPNP